jgi:shikimate kinase
MKIFLLGMMGTGKSHWSKQLGKKLKTGGYDLDFLIESDEEKTIAEIFAEDGEAYFRKAEARILRWFGQKKSFVLATGGGTPCFHDNMRWMNDQGVTIWIDEPVEVLAERLIPEKANRPLIRDLSDTGLIDFLRNKRAEREPVYSLAKHHLNKDINEAAFTKIVKQYA